MIDADRRLATSAISQGRATLLHVAAEANQLHFVKELVKLLSDERLGTTRLQSLFGIFADLALKVLREKPRLALARNENQETGLHVLTRKPSSFSCRGGLGQRFLNMLTNSGKSPTLALQLVKCLWETLLSQDGIEMQTIIKVISEPSHVIFIATEVGNFEVLAELVRSYPDLMWEVDTKKRSIIHIAVLHRHADIFNLIHETSSIRNFVATLEDEDKNNLLHYAAKLSPPSKLNLLPGAVFQMNHELLWYEDVKKIMQPCFIEIRNSDGKTPIELFTEEHSELVTKAESWMKSRINSCITISTITATLVLAIAFSVKPEDYLDSDNISTFIFLTGMAMMHSLFSSLIFLSIHITARYADEEFLKSLPSNLMSGLATLFMSITNMMTAFIIAFLDPKNELGLSLGLILWVVPLLFSLFMRYLPFPFGPYIVKNPAYKSPSKYIFYTRKAKAV
ncbi:uncharacterized protein LOC114404378 [Glycine soja]|uniref:uncharacterized protein LOC114404378 n=1 Tax=Glycine soja TaxID=3848 RepID=UPI001039BC1D|nr:uncharacterized protein LOC114404378 [Glycine soja]